jgi:hypothetical protein
MTVNDKTEPADNSAPCPICGGRADRGCLYAADRSRMHWFDGPVSMGKNFLTAIGGGVPVGHSKLLAGSHAVGIRCTKCRRIVLDDEKEG